MIYTRLISGHHCERERWKGQKAEIIYYDVGLTPKDKKAESGSYLKNLKLGSALDNPI